MRFKYSVSKSALGDGWMVRAQLKSWLAEATGHFEHAVVNVEADTPRLKAVVSQVIVLSRLCLFFSPSSTFALYIH